jgi:hypothetical protein
MDDATKLIINCLNDHDIAINAIFFSGPPTRRRAIPQPRLALRPWRNTGQCGGHNMLLFTLHSGNDQ